LKFHVSALLRRTPLTRPSPFGLPVMELVKLVREEFQRKIETRGLDIHKKIEQAKKRNEALYWY